MNAKFDMTEGWASVDSLHGIIKQKYFQSYCQITQIFKRTPNKYSLKWVLWRRVASDSDKNMWGNKTFSWKIYKALKMHGTYCIILQQVFSGKYFNISNRFSWQRPLTLIKWDVIYTKTILIY